MVASFFSVLIVIPNFTKPSVFSVDDVVCDLSLLNSEKILESHVRVSSSTKY